MMDVLMPALFIGLPLAWLMWLMWVIWTLCKSASSCGTWCTCSSCYQRDLKTAVEKREWTEQHRRIIDAVDEVFNDRGRKGSTS